MGVSEQNQKVTPPRPCPGNPTVAITLKDGATFTTLISQITYQPHGPVSAMTFGDGASQGLTYHTSYRATGVLDSNGAVTHRQLTRGDGGWRFGRSGFYHPIALRGVYI